jgi:hypothetical protein
VTSVSGGLIGIALLEVTKTRLSELPVLSRLYFASLSVYGWCHPARTMMPPCGSEHRRYSPHGSSRTMHRALLQAVSRHAAPTSFSTGSILPSIASNAVRLKVGRHFLSSPQASSSALSILANTSAWDKYLDAGLRQDLGGGLVYLVAFASRLLRLSIRGYLLPRIRSKDGLRQDFLSFSAPIA